MTHRTATMVVVLVSLLASIPSTAAAGRNRQCRQTCVAAIAACVETGGRRKVCKRSILRQCRRDPRVCALLFPSTTTTSTTLPPTGISLEVTSVATHYEIGLLVPVPDGVFVQVEITITNHSLFPMSPSTLALYTGGLGYQQFFAYASYYPPQTIEGLCAASTIVPSGQSLTCSVVFHVPDGSTTGYVELPTYGAFPSSTVRSSEFRMPTIPRPYAGLQILAVDSFAGACTPRPGFKLIHVSAEVSSHNGATELTLGGQFSVVADAARYLPGYCVTLVDPCDYRIGVPVDGSASSSMIIELPETVAAGVLEFRDSRYAAMAAFAVP